MKYPAIFAAIAILVFAGIANAADPFFDDQRVIVPIQPDFPLPPDNKPVPFPIPAVSDQADDQPADESKESQCVDCQCQAKGLESASPGFVDERFSQFDARLAAVENPGPGFVDQRLQSNVSEIERRLSTLEGRVTTLDGRVERVEEQLKAILTMQKDDGTKITAEVPIDPVTGHGEYVVPGSFRTIAINGVPVARSSMATNATNVRYVTPQFTAQRVSGRTVRIFPRLFGSGSRGTCYTDPATGMRVCN